MARLVLFIGVMFILGCSTIDRQKCRNLQSKGLVQGTLDSCTKCVGQLGSENTDAISGCALGMDTANLIGAIK